MKKIRQNALLLLRALLLRALLLRAPWLTLKVYIFSFIRIHQDFFIPGMNFLQKKNMIKREIAKIIWHLKTFIVWCVRHVCLPGTPWGWADKITWFAMKLFLFFLIIYTDKWGYFGHPAKFEHLLNFSIFYLFCETMSVPIWIINWSQTSRLHFELTKRSPN